MWPHVSILTMLALKVSKEQGKNLYIMGLVHVRGREDEVGDD